MRAKDGFFYNSRHVDSFLATQELRDPSVEPFREPMETTKKRKKALIAAAKRNKRLRL